MNKIRQTLVIFSKHIHSCFASMSSNDAWLTREVIIPFGPYFMVNAICGIEQGLQGVPTPQGETISELGFYPDPEGEYDLLDIHLKPDETFYRRGLHSSKRDQDYSKDPEFITLVVSHTTNGWSEKLSPFAKKIQKRIRDYEHSLKVADRTLKGFVIPDYKNPPGVPGYQGCLSDAVYNNACLQKYVASGGVCGYIGHSNRTFELDKKFEKACRKLGLNDSQIAVFCTHTRGRHFADNFDDGQTEGVEKRLKEFITPDINLAEF